MNNLSDSFLSNSLPSIITIVLNYGNDISFNVELFECLLNLKRDFIQVKLYRIEHELCKKHTLIYSFKRTFFVPFRMAHIEFGIMQLIFYFIIGHGLIRTSQIEMFTIVLFVRIVFNYLTKQKQ